MNNNVILCLGFIYSFIKIYLVEVKRSRKMSKCIIIDSSKEFNGLNHRSE